MCKNIFVVPPLFYVAFGIVVVEQEVVVGIFLHVQFAHPFVDKVFEIVDIGLLACGDKYGIVAEACHPRVL